MTDHQAHFDENFRGLPTVSFSVEISTGYRESPDEPMTVYAGWTIFFLVWTAVLVTGAVVLKGVLFAALATATLMAAGYFASELIDRLFRKPVKGLHTATLRQIEGRPAIDIEGVGSDLSLNTLEERGLDYLTLASTITESLDVELPTDDTMARVGAVLEVNEWKIRQARRKVQT